MVLMQVFKKARLCTIDCFRYFFLSLELMVTNIHILIDSYIRILPVMPISVLMLILVL